MTCSLEKSVNTVELTSEDFERLMEAASDTITDYEDTKVDTRDDLFEHHLGF